MMSKQNIGPGVQANLFYDGTRVSLRLPDGRVLLVRGVMFQAWEGDVTYTFPPEQRMDNLSIDRKKAVQLVVDDLQSHLAHVMGDIQVITLMYPDLARDIYDLDTGMRLLLFHQAWMGKLHTISENLQTEIQKANMGV